MQPALPPEGFGVLPFVGREDEIGTILGAVARARGVATVEGPPGMGKSRLLGELADRLKVPVLAARASPPERDEAWGLARTLLLEALRGDPRAVTRLPERSAEALADVLPEVEEVRKVRASAADPASRRALALEAAVRLVEEYAPEGLVVAVDDLQWVDATSLTVLGLLLRRIPLMGLVVAVRPEAVASGEAVTGFLRDLPEIASTVVTISLGPLSAGALRDVVDGGELAEVIVEETGGGPFAVAEVLRAVAEQGLLVAQPGGRWRPRDRSTTEVARDPPDRRRMRYEIEAARLPGVPVRTLMACVDDGSGRRNHACRGVVPAGPGPAELCACPCHNGPEQEPDPCRHCGALIGHRGSCPTWGARVPTTRPRGEDQLTLFR